MGIDRFVGFYGSDRFARVHGSDRRVVCGLLWLVGCDLLVVACDGCCG